MSKLETRGAGGDAKQLRLSDAETFLEVVRFGSVNGAARALRVSPSQVSKALARLERHLGVKLVARSPHGVVPTSDGEHLCPALFDVLARARNLRRTRDRAEITIVAPAFLANALVPRLAARLEGVRVHSIETPPGVPSALAGQPLFDIALSTREERWPESWARSSVGKIRRALFATPAKARQLGASPTVERLQRERFIGPMYADRGQLIVGDDGCPLASRDRFFGHRTQTVALALDVAETSGELVFAPVIAARAHLERGTLVEVPVRGWSVKEPVYLLCHQDRITASVQRALLAVSKAELRRST